MLNKQRGSFELDSCSDLDDINVVTAINLYNKRHPITRAPQPAKDYSQELGFILFTEPKCIISLMK